MPGVGFVLFVLPVLFGVAAGSVLLLVPRLRRFAAYAFLIPTGGALGALSGTIAGLYINRPSALTAKSVWPGVIILVLSFGLGGLIGVTSGALAAKLMNRFIRHNWR
jgi:hypothetical protein